MDENYSPGTHSRPSVTAYACDVTCGKPSAEPSPQTDETSEQALARLADQFRVIAKVSDDYAVNAALLVKAMRILVRNGAAGRGMTWYSWARRLRIPPQRVQRYLRIAEAKNPHAMRDEFLRRDRERQKKFRAKREAIAPERKMLGDWARKAPLAWVARVQQFIEAEKMKVEG